ncbi:MAG: 16S rRNA (uracil(1498)-N(3))-methyltransferase [Deltaproteobacteria bacterium]|nr:MAG: 16S rRNA (uracil(1498)-N(3))-methyltransferase [Deltaproteobacteria bacterium]
MVHHCWKAQGRGQGEAMRRFVVDHILPDQGVVLIEGAEARHIAKALRMEPGDEIVVMDSEGMRYHGLIQSIGTSRVAVEVKGPIATPDTPPLDMVLCQAVLKAKAMDLVIQKVTELGASRIVPFLSRRTVIRLDEKRGENKLRRWKEIARNATAQCDRAIPPQIDGVTDFRQLLSATSREDGLKVILWEQERSRDLKDVLRQAGPQEKIVGMVGPEGGFSREEVVQAMEVGFVPISLGRRILRAETAAMVLVTLCLYEWGDLGLD